MKELPQPKPDRKVLLEFVVVSNGEIVTLQIFMECTDCSVHDSDKMSEAFSQVSRSVFRRKKKHCCLHYESDDSW